MKNFTATITVLSIKITIFYFLLNYCVSIYDKTIPFYYQNIIIWILFYLPFFMGIESIIKVLLTKKKSKQL